MDVMLALTYKTFMIGAMVLLAVGWTIYLLWDRRMKKIEASQPKVRSERLQKTSTEISDWAKKMAAFKKPTYKKPDQDESSPQ
jgi:hypothetical protein